MQSNEIRKRFLEFFEKRGHTVIPSASLIPENDPTTLFTGSGMQPMLPYLLGEKHPQGTRIADSQKCFRTGDINDVGDNRHTTFFEMLGNWSLGDYFQEEQLEWIFEFLVSEIGLNPERLYVTVFAGDKEFGLPKDVQAIEIWKRLFASKNITAKDVDLATEKQGSELGMQGGRIFSYDSEKNWWSRAGTTKNMPIGEPGGPDSEIFYEFESVPHDTKYGKNCHPNCDCGKFLEIGNSVFMQYLKTGKKTFEKLPNKNIDFGGGLERMTTASNNNADIFSIDVFQRALETIEKLSGKKYKEGSNISSFRVIVDHIRSASFLIGDGVLPSNTDQGYFVRRLIRRAVRHADILGIKEEGLANLVEPMLTHYKEAYGDTYSKHSHITDEIKNEEIKFRKTLEKGLKELAKIQDKEIPGSDAFRLFSSFGLPIDAIVDIAKESGRTVDVGGYEKEFKVHQDLSRVGAEKKFKGGLADTSEKTIQYHTATHLLNAALRHVLGNHVGQKGSNITGERLRFDFTHGAKMTDEEKKKVEEFVNEKIQAALPVGFKEIPKAEAEKIAIHAFGEKYGDVVKVYSIGDPSIDSGQVVSREFCGGPHVTNTSDLKGTFKIQKEEAVSAGVRRIKAVLE